MKLIKAKSCKELFFLCIISSILVNIIFYVFNMFFVFYSNNYNFVIISGFLQLCAGFFLGNYLYKNSRNFLGEEKHTRKKYVVITITGVVVMLVTFLCPDIIAMPYMYITRMLYNSFGLDHLFSIYDFGCILVCLASVFLRKV